MTALLIGILAGLVILSMFGNKSRRWDNGFLAGREEEKKHHKNIIRKMEEEHEILKRKTERQREVLNKIQEMIQSLQM